MRFRRGDIAPDIDIVGEIVEGRVEICHESVWSAVYDDNWSNEDAAVACHQLEVSQSRLSTRDRGYRYGMF